MIAGPETQTGAGAGRARKPPWLKVRPPTGEVVRALRADLRGKRLHTVCEEARCPNLGECWGEGTATIMIMGGVCTRGCRFCAVTSGNPGGRLDPDEPVNTARAVAAMGASYLVVTSVDRDDLPDNGAAHFAATIRAVREHAPDTLLEVLIGDLGGDADALAELVAARPDMLAHNVETVRRLSRRVRDVRATYDRSLEVLRRAKALDPELPTKSSIMVGLGETEAEIWEAMDDLRDAGVDVLTLGQYLRPTSRHLPVVDYVSPEQFQSYEHIGLLKGFRYVASGPLVRSSYKAGTFHRLAGLRREDSPRPAYGPLTVGEGADAMPAPGDVPPARAPADLKEV